MESGSILSIKDTVYNAVNWFVVEKIGFGNFTIAKIENPYQRLCIESGKIVYKTGPPSKSNIISLEEVNRTESIFKLGALKSKEKDCKVYDYIGISCSGELCVSSDLNASETVSTLFYVTFTPFSDIVPDVTTLFNVNIVNNNSFKFKQWQLRRFISEGYLQLNNICSQDKISDCIRYLNHYLGKPGEIVPGGVQGGEQLGKFAGHLSNCQSIRNLVYGSVEACIDTLMGGGHCWDKSNLSAQIAYRFPELQNVQLTKVNRDEIAESVAWHTDGLRQGKAHGFSLLLGIVLADITEEFSGNLMVWPGSHTLLHSCKTTEYGALDLIKLRNLIQTDKYYSDFKPTGCTKGGGEKTVKHITQTLASNPTNSVSNPESIHHINEPILPSLGVPHQITARAGDILLLHPDLAHAGGPNYGNDIRKVVYFRIKASTGKSASTPPLRFNSWEDLVTEHAHDMWCDLPIVREATVDKRL